MKLQNKLIKTDYCRVAGDELIDVINLGELPISDFPKPEDQPLEKYPLILALSKKSGLLQLRYTLPQDLLYRQYWYMSGINQSMQNSLRDIVNQIRMRQKLNLGDVVVDIGANDGCLLSNYTNVVRIAFEPALNIETKNCDFLIKDYFSANLYSKTTKAKAKVITSIAMFYDLPDPIKFAQDVEIIMAKDGLWVIELSYLPFMLERNSFETAVHEHIEYYSLQSIEYILSKTNLVVEDIDTNNVNGGSFRLYVRHKDFATPTLSVERTRFYEKILQLNTERPYNEFMERINQNKKELLDFIEQEKQKGKVIGGYSASTKGNTMMAYLGLDKSILPWVADRNPIKWGRETATRIPIISEEEMHKLKPDYLLVFAYHFLNEMIDREKEFLLGGGKFIVPIPKLTIIDKDYIK